MADCALFILWNWIDGLALMEDRPDLKPGSDHYWVYPGGKVNSGESWPDAMVRECLEETGCRPGRYDVLAGAGDLRVFPREGTKQWTKAHEGWRTIPYIVWLWTGKPPMRSLDTGAPLRWISPQDIDQRPDGYTCAGQVAKLLITEMKANAPNTCS